VRRNQQIFPWQTKTSYKHRVTIEKPKKGDIHDWESQTQRRKDARREAELKGWEATNVQQMGLREGETAKGAKH